MGSMVKYERKGDIGVITVDHPPVNALDSAVRQGLIDCLELGLSDPEAQALVLVGAGRTFIAGADIREFDKPVPPPYLPEVIARYEQANKPVVVALHGTALGGGLEVALGCHYRVALATAKLGLPEVKLGLLPGAGGTQRLPRLVGPRKALELVTSGDLVTARQAVELGIVDVIGEAQTPLEAGLEFARRVIEERLPLRRVRDQGSRIRPDHNHSGLFDEFRKTLQQRAKGLYAPFQIVDCIQDAVALPFEEGLKRERERFLACKASPQRAGLVHAFLTDRAVTRVSGLADSGSPREIARVGILGAGTMGGGIAMCFANAGIPVTLVEVKREALDRGLAVIRQTYANSVRKGRLSEAEREQRLALIHPTLDDEALGEVDLVIEAAVEDMAIKQTIFARLDRLCKPGALLASNTSTLSIDVIASATRRPGDVLGMHFFSPANVMKLLEVVRGRETTDVVAATAMALAKRIGKVGVLVGNGYGFVGNRMLHKRAAEAMALVDEGASPARVDQLLTDFGFPMGQFAMADLAGVDVGYRIRQERRKSGEMVPPTWMDRLVEVGRLGQKTQAGTYRYEAGSRQPFPDPAVEALIAQFRQEQGITPRPISDREILERCLYVMVNEGAKILEEGIAARALDIDVVWRHGYGFPAYRGGPMFWADQLGLEHLLDTVKRYHRQRGGEAWRPARLLQRLVEQGGGFGEFN